MTALEIHRWLRAILAVAPDITIVALRWSSVQHYWTAIVETAAGRAVLHHYVIAACLGTAQGGEPPETTAVWLRTIAGRQVAE